MALVGQAVRQRVQFPQWFFSGGSGASSKVVRISARKIQLPTPADDVGVLAHETKAGALREVTLQQRPGVHVPERTRLRAAKLVDKLGQSS